uniref:Uncharacterized protein n=1 Tax=Rhizophora mucronata TaxID=61149 RepID=A0A2P2NWE9_RHIMU
MTSHNDRHEWIKGVAARNSNSKIEVYITYRHVLLSPLV